MGEQGLPGNIRSNNGSEFIAGEVKEWPGSLGVETLFIQPGASWDNGFVESFNSRPRYELLNGKVFITLKEAQQLAKHWKEHYIWKRLQFSELQDP